MDCSKTGENKGFRYEWTIENFSHAFYKRNRFLRSPSFRIGHTKWCLTILSAEYPDRMKLGVTRDVVCQGPLSVAVVFRCTVHKGLNVAHVQVRNCRRGETYLCLAFRPPERLPTSAFSSVDSLTVLFWMKSVNAFEHVGYSFARTRIEVRRVYSDWKISNFSAIEPGMGRIMSIRSSENGEQCKTFLHLFVTRGSDDEKLINFQFESHDEQVHCCNFRLSLVHARGHAVECCREELLMDVARRTKIRKLFLTKEGLLAQRHLYLPHDALTLNCECTFTTGISLNVIEKEGSGSNSYQGLPTATTSHEDATRTPRNLLRALQDFRSLYDDKSLCDVKLQTSTSIFEAHKVFLIARSPVFKAMFHTDMRENAEGCVRIADLKDDTLRRMLEYVYTAAIEDLGDWESASELYEAADKYQILSLKEMCSEFLKSHLRVANACRILVLSDMHCDDGLKSAAQNFIWINGRDIINSREWTDLMASHLTLANDTMHPSFKK